LKYTSQKPLRVLWKHRSTLIADLMEYKYIKVTYVEKLI
jgi:hypothetical protein